jgi:transcriptional regulator with XRE-family HTH domain
MRGDIDKRVRAARKLERARLVELGKRIREARQLAGVRVVELAAFLGVAEDTVYRWEIGKHRAPAELLEALADFLRVSRTWLLTGQGEARAA